MKDKQNLIRIVKDENGVFIDRTGKANGRGAYICDDVECLKKAVKAKRFEKSLKCMIPKEIYETLEKKAGPNGG